MSNQNEALGPHPRWTQEFLGWWLIAETNGCRWTKSPGKAAATTLRALAKYGPPATNTIGQSQVIAAMQAGDAAQGQVVFAAANSMNDPAASRVAGKIGFAVMPKGCASCNPGVVSGTWAISIPTGLSSEREKAALSYINWVMSKKAQIKFAEYGGIPTRTDVIAEANLTATQIHLK